MSRLLVGLVVALWLASTSGPAWAAQWVWPIAPPPGRTTPVVLSSFAPPAERWQPGRRGVLLAAPPGTVVRAAGAGTVVYAGQLFGRGVVAVSHGDIRTTYLPVTPSVHDGDHVLPGTPIGRLDPPPDASTPSGLHWGLVTGHGHDAHYLDPLALLGVGTVRLLPVPSAPGTVPSAPGTVPAAIPAMPSPLPRAAPRPSGGGTPPWALGAAALPLTAIAAIVGTRRVRR
jgi:hypothetical protein